MLTGGAPTEPRRGSRLELARRRVANLPPPPRRRRSDDPDPERERALWAAPMVIGALFLATLALTLGASHLVPDLIADVTVSRILLVSAVALNVAIMIPLVHLIVEQRRALSGPERRRNA